MNSNKETIARAKLFKMTGTLVDAVNLSFKECTVSANKEKTKYNLVGKVYFGGVLGEKKTQTGFQELAIDKENKTFTWLAYEPITFAPELRRDGGSGKGEKVNDFYLGSIVYYKTLPALQRHVPEIHDYDFKVEPATNLSPQAQAQYASLGITPGGRVPYKTLREKLKGFLEEKNVLGLN